ncbi:DNA-processing protein DprA [Ottowia testudinis]|uniref:DNA-processing protein DprA n=1 Tax=Ottowia testudinis TaxID=2816950 RepID=A0A975CGZ5_9BURK|nr:DNA-processing protein DprA [Ottowia testudinis]QTD45621.1 DNA-processing protein DprA [Ottowia testudinis]
MDRPELEAWLRLTLTPGIGSDTARRLLAAFGLPQAIFEQPSAALRELVGPAQASALLTAPEPLAAQLQATQGWLAAAGDDAPRAIVTLGDAAYPYSLLAIEDPPCVLYTVGHLLRRDSKPKAALALAEPARAASETIANGWPQRALAMVGSRNPTPQGAQNARQFARALAGSGVTIVSGLALGIDAAAHEGALDSSPSGVLATIAVIGTGIDRVYPRQHRELAHRIAARGLIVSEYPIGTPPLAHNFPRRNRLIAGLAQGTLVVEAALQSGSLITARLAGEQGKEVFAIPGSIHSPQSRGCHALIRQGAKLVETAEDVLEELRWPGAVVAARHAAAAADPAPESSPSDPGHALLQALGADPVGLDALLARTGLDTPTLQARLLALELDGRVGRLPGGLFQRLGAG